MRNRQNKLNKLRKRNTANSLYVFLSISLPSLRAERAHGLEGNGGLLEQKRTDTRSRQTFSRNTLVTSSEHCS